MKRASPRQSRLQAAPTAMRGEIPSPGPRLSVPCQPPAFYPRITSSFSRACHVLPCRADHRRLAFVFAQENVECSPSAVVGPGGRKSEDHPF